VVPNPFRWGCAEPDANTRHLPVARSISRIAALPAEVLDKLTIEFYSEPSQAAFKALAD
jgi:predicted ATP-dependent Lon-type protease